MRTYSNDARDTWRMPPLDELPPPHFRWPSVSGMGVLRGYLLVAVVLVVAKVVQMTLLKVSETRSELDHFVGCGEGRHRGVIGLLGRGNGCG